MKFFIQILFCSVFSCSLNAQSNSDPIFSTFNGTVYKIPSKNLLKGYTKSIPDYETIAEISLPELNIPERLDNIKIRQNTFKPRLRNYI